MTALALSLLWKFWPVIVAALGWLGARTYYKRQGAAEEKAKRDAADARVRDVADEIESDIRVMSDEQVLAELRKKAKR